MFPRERMLSRLNFKSAFTAHIYMNGSGWMPRISRRSGTKTAGERWVPTKGRPPGAARMLPQGKYGRQRTTSVQAKVGTTDRTCVLVVVKASLTFWIQHLL